MTNTNELQIVKDLPKRKITITRNFDASPELVWKAWTESELLDQWWAPQPWKAETKTFSFKVGGYWLYAMVGPDGTKHWARVDFTAINTNKSFEVDNYFCDENGVINNAFPVAQWKNEFVATKTGTKVVVEISFEKETDLKVLVEMGFEAGFAAALGNLDHYLSTGFKLRKEYKTTNKARVATYLNFPGNTEEAFNFYKKVFRGEFTGGGLKRFGDIELPAGQPPLSEADKKLIIHAELIILGGHVLMATDAPESMGFKMVRGNNMHICLEPDSREETKRLFDALSEGGVVTMPLADMFFGSYFGEFTDKYGINWMVNFQAGS
jgi:uncharacterized glyoxalase superfamily protein PhnB/uncharacterized protein YndB with AHSA1/START domain